MKKLFYLLLGVLLFLPTLVKADMGAPIIREYKASVINPNGATIYEYGEDDKYEATDDVIEYGKQVFVESEVDIEDGFISVNLGDVEESYCIKLKDITLITKNYKVNKKELTDKENAIVLKEVRIRKGPAEGYDSTGVTLEKGTNINIQWFKDSDNDETDPYEGEYDSDNPWVYVEYNGTKGFINTYGGTVAYRELKKEVMNSTAVSIRDVGSKQAIKTIPANTVIKSKVYLLDAWSSDYYIVYEGTEGLVDEYLFVVKDDEKEFTTTKKLNIYEEAGYNKKGKVKTTIPVGAVVKSSFYSTTDACTIYYTKGDLTGWIYSDYDDDGECGLIWEEDLDDEDVKKDTKSSKKTGLSILYIGVGVVIVLILIVGTTIVLVNKKKREN